MTAISKNGYPKAMPLRPPEEVATPNSRLTQMNEELAAQAKRLKEWKDELEKRAVRLRRWTLRLAAACVVTALLAGVGVWVALSQPRGSAAVPLVEVPRTDFLEALGSLSATHLYQTHLNIGLLADGVESETYSVEEAEKNLKSVVEMMETVEAQQARLAKSGLEPDDLDSMRQIQAVSAMLHLQIDALRAYWKTEEVEQADQYHLARKATWQGLSKVLGMEK
jgi:hypothetical protein